MDSDEPVYSMSMQVGSSFNCFAWRPNGKKDDDEDLEAARKSKDNFTIAWYVTWSSKKIKIKKIYFGSLLTSRGGK